MYGLPESAASEIYPFAGTGYLRRIVILRPRVVKVTPPVVSWFVTFSVSLSDLCVSVVDLPQKSAKPTVENSPALQRWEPSPTIEKVRVSGRLKQTFVLVKFQPSASRTSGAFRSRPSAEALGYFHLVRARTTQKKYF